MKLKFCVPSLDQVFETTLWTQLDDVSPFWRDQLYIEYPEINKEKAMFLSEKKRMDYLRDELGKIYRGNLEKFHELSLTWQKYWDNHVTNIESALSAAYEIDLGQLLNDCVGYVNLNPVCPRYLDSHTFYVFYKMKPDRVLRTSLHEIMHFLWFYKWQEHFHDNPQEYDIPHLKWIFSEMVQDTMVRDTPIAPLFDGRESAYDYFYTMEIAGAPILSTLSECYKNSGLIGLFENGYAYCQKHEDEIRAKIKEAEKQKKY